MAFFKLWSINNLTRWYHVWYTQFITGNNDARIWKFIWKFVLNKLLGIFVPEQTDIIRLQPKIYITYKIRYEYLIYLLLKLFIKQIIFVPCHKTLWEIMTQPDN